MRVVKAAAVHLSPVLYSRDGRRCGRVAGSTSCLMIRHLACQPEALRISEPKNFLTTYLIGGQKWQLQIMKFQTPLRTGARQGRT